MTSMAYYLTHPQVDIDPTCEITDWRLSAEGHARIEQFAAANPLDHITRVISSAERKARETAEPIARAAGCQIEIRDLMGENDRSATGYLPPAEFEATATKFFNHPRQSIRGWERAIDAQARIKSEVQLCLDRDHDGDTIFVGHGGVGTLLYCALAGLSIDRRHDQLAGGGCCFSFSLPDMRPTHGWKLIEHWNGN